LIETFSDYSIRYRRAGWVPRPMVAALVATVLIISAGAPAWALDCLAYKPAGARGLWHADVVSGKICWYGPNWRSFLPKPKQQAESAHAANSKSEPAPAPANRATEPSPSSAAAADTDLPALRAATPAEAEALINAVSLDFDPAQSEPAAAPPPAVARPDMSGAFFAMGALAIGGLALVILIYKRRKRRPAKQKLVDDTGGRDRGLERVRISPPLAALELPDPDGFPSPARRRIPAMPGRY
jgi:hypothetical protein